LEIDIILPIKEILEKAIEYAKNFDITTYYSVYVSLASILNTKPITADEKFIKKCKLPFVVHLEDVSV